MSGRLATDATVFLVDDDASVRKALTRLLRSAGYDVKAFASAREFLDNAQDEGPACLVLDIRMPGLSGIDLQRELQTANAILPIIFITGHGDIPTSVKAMKAGAVDFLPKPVKDHDLLTGIEQALARSARERAERADLEDIQSRIDSLTPRERQVLEHVVAGQLNKEVAYDLGTVEKTIKVHRARVMDKMGVKSLAELVRLAERAGIGKT
jgi:FixJ family two-component response regulator